VLARDIRTGKQKIVEMKSAVDVDDSAVKKMVEESVEHAFDDMAARRWIEAKLRAKDTLGATRKAMTECADDLEPAYKGQLDEAVRALEEALATEDPSTQIGDAQKLKAANGALDEATKPLADLLMDRAIDAALKKKGLV
jgi:molecular chaperone DnaK (HSP70)